MSGLRILAVDDEPPALDDLARVLRGNARVAEVTLAGSARDALQELAKGAFDAVFLDVRMPGLDGVELARVLKRFAQPPPVVFVSAYESAAVQAFELNAVDYLMKPVSRARVDETLARLTSAAQATAADPAADADETIPVDAPRGGTRLVPRSSILYLQAHGDYVRIVADDGRFLLRARITDLEQRWAAHQFFRVHRRFVVNLRRAKEVRPQINGTAVLVLDGGAEVPIARRQVADLRRRLKG